MATAAAKSTGTVKWFSNRKGFGFIAPTSENCPTTEDIFVHQTSIVTDGDYRTLQENATVEFEVVTEADTGKFKAVNVTGVGGTPIVPPAREPRRRRQPRTKKEGDNEKSGDDDGAAAPAAGADSGDDENKASKENGKTGGGKSNNNRRARGRRTNNSNSNAKSDDEQQKTATESKPRDPPFHSVFTEDAKQKIADKSVELGRKSTVDVALGGSRIKLGQGGYAAFADAKGIVGEGTYTCDENAKIMFEWKRAIECTGGEWKVSDAGKLMKELNLAQDGIGPVKEDETPETLWGADKPDPKDVIQQNEFLMRRVALTRPRGRGRRGPPRAKKDAAKE